SSLDDLLLPSMDIATRWWDIVWSDVSSFADWYLWFDTIRLPSKLKLVLEGVFFIAWWHIWVFQNQSIFDVSSPRSKLTSSPPPHHYRRPPTTIPSAPPPYTNPSSRLLHSRLLTNSTPPLLTAHHLDSSTLDCSPPRLHFSFFFFSSQTN
ncbi:hypothetical protein Tco_0702426, partial [Tanacetum coccineum]